MNPPPPPPRSRSNRIHLTLTPPLPPTHPQRIFSGGPATTLSDSDPYPRAVVEICADAPTRTTLNKRFRETFGFKEADFDGTCPFTTGFLPWGGDFLCRMLLTEKEVTTFLHIMAIMFGSAGPVVLTDPNKTATRDIASVHIVNLIRRDPEADVRNEIRSPLEWPSQYINCLAKVVHRETASGSSAAHPNVKMQVIFTFEPLSEVLTYNHELLEREMGAAQETRGGGDDDAESPASTPSLTTTGVSSWSTTVSPGFEHDRNVTSSTNSEWEVGSVCGGDERGRD